MVSDRQADDNRQVADKRTGGRQVDRQTFGAEGQTSRQEADKWTCGGQVNRWRTSGQVAVK